MKLPKTNVNANNETNTVYATNGIKTILVFVIKKKSTQINPQTTLPILFSENHKIKFKRIRKSVLRLLGIYHVIL